MQYPLVLGHEFVGRVEDVGPGVTRVQVGARVAVEPNYSCGACAALPRGQSKPLPEPDGRRYRCRRLFCRARSGARALLLARARERRPTTTSWSPSRWRWWSARWPRRAVRPGESAAVVGGGTLGLLALQVLRAHGARVLVVSRTARRFALARELGAEATHVVDDGPLEAVARRFSGARGRGRGDRDRGDGGGRRPRADAGEAGGPRRADRLAPRAHRRGVLLGGPARGDDQRVDDLSGRVPRGDAADRVRSRAHAARW